MTVLVTSEHEGIRFPIALDGALLWEGLDSTEIFPSQFTVLPQPIQDHVDTLDGGAQTFQPFAGLGHSDFAERNVFTIPFASCHGPMRTQLERARKMGIIHTFAYWKPLFEFYTTPGSISLFYLPHQRRNVATALGGLNWRGVSVDTDTFPMSVKLAGVAQTVAYEDGPLVSVPAAGTVNVAKLPDDTGHVRIQFHTAIVQGELIEVEYFPLFLVTINQVTQTFARGLSEAHSYQIQER